MKRLSKRALRDSDEGVATTVGTIMALLVFLSLLSLITQQYVPVWMEDNEAYHMEEVMTQFSSMKGNIDTLIMNNRMDYPMFSTARLGAEGVPMFASATQGAMRVTPRWGEMTLELTEDGQPRTFQGQGNISLNVQNRYFEEQTVVYEHGAIILEQPQGAVVRAPPHIRIEEDGGEYSVSLTMIDISNSQRISAGGSGVVGITTELFSTTERDFTNPENVTISLETAYPAAWQRWFEENTDVGDLEIDGNQLNIELNSVSNLSVTRARFDIKLSV